MGSESAPYPNRLIRIVVPLPAGGNMDALSRVIAEKLSASVGQPVIIENKTGASGGIGASAVAQSKPDGYTILFAIASTIEAVGLQKNPPFKLSELARSPNWLKACLPASRCAPICRLERLPISSNSRKRSRGSELWLGRQRIDWPHHRRRPGCRSRNQNVACPDKGEAPAITDLLGGHISSAFASVGGLGQYPDKVKLLAITGPHRLKGFPDVPTFQQLGYPLHGLTGWAGVFAPAATPLPIIDKLATEIGRIVRLPDVQAKILDFGFEPLGETTEPFAGVCECPSGALGSGSQGSGDRT